MQVHGCLYDIGLGKIRDLGLGAGAKAGAAADADAKGGDSIVRGKHAMLVFRDGSAGMKAG